jgi:hypothetical protein
MSPLFHRLDELRHALDDDGMDFVGCPPTGETSTLRYFVLIKWPIALLIWFPIATVAVSLLQLQRFADRVALRKGEVLAGAPGALGCSSIDRSSFGTAWSNRRFTK